MSTTLKKSCATACCLAVLFGVAISSTQARADDGERAIWARQGFMNLVSWEAGPLFAMAKGDMPYDATAAQGHADKLKTLYQYPFTTLFLPGTSKADRPGKTRALPEIWQNRDKFEERFHNERALVAALGEQAANGQPALAAAVSELGKGCGGCHKQFRAKDY